jgi:hypothetical protein
VSATGADAATQLGETFTPTGNCSPRTRLQISFGNGLYAAPEPGVITSWSFERSMSGGESPLKLKVARGAGGDQYAIVGESEFQNPAVGLNTYPVRIAVQAGDVIGTHASPASVFLCSRSSLGAVIGLGPFGTDVAPGPPAAFPPLDDQQLDVSAVLEPDCDADGFGDESQDPDTLSCPPAPQATITRAPKDRVKTKRKRKRVTFEFTANEPATFECSLDDAPFASCASPFSAKVKRGRHEFAVRATDAGGNAGAAATDTWKVKRKRKRR